MKAIARSRGLATHHLLSSLVELVQFHGNCTVAVRSGAVQVLIQIVESTDGEARRNFSRRSLSPCKIRREVECFEKNGAGGECDGERVEKKVHAEQGGCGGNPPPPF